MTYLDWKCNYVDASTYPRRPLPVGAQTQNVSHHARHRVRRVVDFCHEHLDATMLKAFEANMRVASGQMAYSFPKGVVVAAVAIGLIFGVIAALIPARQAAGMEIVRALRYE